MLRPKVLLQLLSPLALVALVAPGGGAFTPEPTTYRVYLLAGQSNMDGYGRCEELSAEQEEALEGAVIFHGDPAPDGSAKGGLGLWAPLRPGHGRGFRSDGESNRYSNAFGLELTFARTLQELQPGSPIALVKYSRGGTSIHADAAGGFGCWEPDWEGGEGAGKGLNQYDHCLATLRTALAARDVDGDGVEDRLVPAGILWMQGESDAFYSPEIAGQYEANLKRLMDLLRAALRQDDLPVVIGRISDSGASKGKSVWPHGEVVRAAQAAFVEADGSAALVTSTDGYAYSDPWHYDTAGFLDLGVRFAEALHGINR